MGDRPQEVVLAQEQGAFLRESGMKREVESEFGFDVTEGTLVLTDRRVVFVCTNKKVVDVPVGIMGTSRMIYSEVEDLAGVPEGPPNVFIPIASISSVKGHGGALEKPGLEIGWNDGGEKRSVVVTEDFVGGRKKSLKDWVPVIESLKAGKQKLVGIPSAPPIDTLQGKIVRVLSDMQEKGVLEIEEDVEEEFNLDLEPDDVQAACDELTSMGALIRYPDPSGDVFYRRVSPLGEDDLSG